MILSGSHIKNKRYVDAMNMLMRFALACDASQATSSQCKAYLGAVVVGLYAGNATEAWATYQVSQCVFSPAVPINAVCAQRTKLAYGMTAWSA